MKDFLAVFAERYVVFAWGDAEREVFALIIRLDGVLVAGFGAQPFHIGLRDGFAIDVLADSFDAAGGLRQDEGRRQTHRQDEQ